MDREVLDFAVDLAERAGALAAERFFGGGARVPLKPDGSEVTEADAAVEELIRAELARHVPDDGVHGEEGGASEGTSGRRWVIDPIDGTYCFARGIPLFSTTLAVEDEHGPAVGVIHEPVTGRTTFAGRGRGCLRSVGARVVPVRVSDRAVLGGARTAAANPGTWSEQLLLALHREVFLLPLGDTACLVAGELDAFVVAGAPVGYEDLAPLPVIVREAGGRITDLNGDPVLSGDGTVLATNGLLHDDLLTLVRGVPHARDRRTSNGA
ncbi:inositol monophosphatase family protein [Saccharothrix coeruleofusca]|uniref:Histidinol-phosphatase n=1 Tax=Saccharothrix coeruleofusca TaxID=33919 RepID=A0A918EGY9_9PSEU|nr:inositol monophosphatase family protein [Saccharothrix coeruleofusca]GGP75217.1 histidinol-phosphatase [Saccharothrix coeruleofusca]